MGAADYHSVLSKMKLEDGRVFPIPVTLPVPLDVVASEGRLVALQSLHSELLAVMQVEELFQWDAELEAEAVLGTFDPAHPLAAEMRQWDPLYVSGRLEVFRLPRHPDFSSLRRTPAGVREELSRLGRADVVAFQTRNPMHRAHEELTKRACERIEGTLLIHPVVGVTKFGDVDSYTRVRCYQALVRNHYDQTRTLLSLLPLAMRMAGPREAVWHAIIRRNFGANHLIVGRDHAGPGHDPEGRPFYDPLAAAELLRTLQAEVGVKPVTFSEMVYVRDEQRYEERSSLAPETAVWHISGTELRTRYLNEGRSLPSWFTRPEVAAILHKAYPPRSDSGFCVWLTGLPCAGKTTLAEALVARLMEHGRSATLLDGDIVRRHLSKGLGFSKADRIVNNERMGFVASEIVRHHGVVVCAAVSPFEEGRIRARELVGEDRFVLLYVDTPFHECERRDVKGMYARVRRGEIQGFTGVDDPYEVPTDAHVHLRTLGRSVNQCIDALWAWLRDAGFVEDLAVGTQTPAFASPGGPGSPLRGAIEA